VKVVLYGATSSKAQIKPEVFHRTINGSQVDLYTLKNLNGLEANISTPRRSVPGKSALSRFANPPELSDNRANTG
jgi:hypothetical protein